MRKVMYCLTSVIVAVTLIGFSVSIVQAGSCELPDFSSANFTTPLIIDNPYWPLVPGTTFVYEPVPNEDNVVNTIEVTNRTKKIKVDGKKILCRVVYDVEEFYVEDLNEWFMTEETYDWYAQDDDGNIWYCGEDTTEFIYDESWDLFETSTEGSWEAGDDGALPGYLILAEPRPGVCYQQEYYEDEAEDMAKVLRLNTTVSTELDDYEDCLVTKEWTPLEPGNVEHKYYAPGVGLVYIEELKEKTVNVELVDIIITP